jgi:hypothetical protein
MEENKMLNYIKEVLENMPTGWLNLTTHRLDIYDEKLAKVQFLEQFENLFNDNNSESSALSEIPTAYDYIRLGHPLSKSGNQFFITDDSYSSHSKTKFIR